jgi:hypothetical protein
MSAYAVILSKSSMKMVHVGVVSLVKGVARNSSCRWSLLVVFLLASDLDDAWKDVWLATTLFGVARRPKALHLSRWHTCVVVSSPCM